MAAATIDTTQSCAGMLVTIQTNEGVSTALCETHATELVEATKAKYRSAVQGFVQGVKSSIARSPYFTKKQWSDDTLTKLVTGAIEESVENDSPAEFPSKGDLGDFYRHAVADAKDRGIKAEADLEAMLKQYWREAQTAAEDFVDQNTHGYWQTASEGSICQMDKSVRSQS